MKRTLITAALPYANGFTHLGHSAGVYLPADIFARFMRLSAEKTLFVCGSDEHGAAITISAEKEKVSPREIIDKYHFANKEAFHGLGISFDIFSRTSLPEHHKTAQEFFLDLKEKGFLTEKEEPQFYDAEARMFLPDRYVEGICPNCGYDKARGDQCDKCSSTYNQLELKNPVSIISGKKPEIRNTSHWYFRLGDFQEKLEQYIESHAKDWKENVLQQTRSWLKAGLGDRPITRDLSWGIPVPLPDSDGKVIYVWFEAVLGYISDTKDWALQNGTPDAWKEWWQSDDTDYYAFLAKDNIVFHTIIFPAILMAKGGYILPTNVPGNEFLNLEGQKFSKSRNWGVELHDFLSDFPEKNAADALRYTLAMNMPETKDSDFTWKDFQARNNNELAAIFGNFVNRTMQFLQKNFNGIVPELPERYRKLPEAWKLLIDDLRRENLTREEAQEHLESKHLRYFTSHDFTLVSALFYGVKNASEKFREFRFRDAINEIMNIARAANKYFNDTEPWKTVKNSPEECAKSLYICSQMLRSLAVVFSPLVPFSAQKLARMVGEDISSEKGSGENVWESALYPLLGEKRQLATPEILFTKIEDDVIAKQAAKLQSPVEDSAGEKQTFITIDDFKQVQLRTGIVLSAENVKKSEKLLKLQVDLGTEKRQILAGIAKYYSAEEMVGKTVVVVANLAPAKLMGHESQGMLLAANTEDGKLALVTPEKAGISAGAEVR